VRSRTTGTFTATSSDPAELTIAVHSQGTTQLTLPQTWLPAVVPALVAGDLPAAADGNDFGLAGLDGEQRPAAEVARLARVPASGPDTALVNLDLVARGSVVGTTADVQLWFAEDDPALLQRVRSALERHGVTVSRTTTLGDVRQVLDQSAAAWSLQLAAVVGVAALLIALLVLAVSAASTWRLRTRDLAALRMSGVPRRTVAAMSVAAQLPAVVVGVVAGTAAGLYGAHLALPIVPLLAHEPEVSTVDLGTAWPAVAAAVAVTLVVLGLAAVALGRAQAGGSHVRRLRETL
jgi:hypothetical protein